MSALSSDVLHISERPRPRGDIQYLLLTPPLTDPTSPYHSISYLAGATTAAGFTGCHAIDVNIDALNYLAREDQVSALLERVAAQRAQIEKKTALSRREQLVYPVLLSAVGLAAGAVEEAISTFRDAERFYEYLKYSAAAMTVTRWIRLLEATGPSLLYDGFEINRYGPINLNRITDLTSQSMLDGLEGQLSPYFVDCFDPLVMGQEWDLVGLSVNYLSQLPYALALVRRIRSCNSSVPVILGGTEVADDIKYMIDKSRLFELFSAVDGIVVGEGESALVEILESIRRSGQPLPALPNLLTPDSALEVHPVYEDVDRLPSPRYDIWDWPSYWSPGAVALYSPTRGCYWNRCTFCDYGLNSDRPTSPSRERNALRVASELAQLAPDIGHVYFAVDAMSPIYLRKLSSELAAQSVSISWSAELRLERTMNRSDLVARLKEAGCVAISFGYESGSQRILDLIDKGIRITEVPGVLESLSALDIGAQMMGFTGFPSESPAEACDTYEFLLSHDGMWTVAGIGEFVLTEGSIVAREPQRFGVMLLDSPAEDDIRRWVRWAQIEDPDDDLLSTLESEEELTRLAQAVIRFPDDRPFVGGIDSAHSLLYFSRYGASLVPPELFEPSHDEGETGATTWTPFSDLFSFAQPKDLEGQHRLLMAERGVTAREVAVWLDETREVARSDFGTHVEISPAGTVLPLEDSVNPVAHEVRQMLLRARGLV